MDILQGNRDAEPVMKVPDPFDPRYGVQPKLGERLLRVHIPRQHVENAGQAYRQLFPQLLRSCGSRYSAGMAFICNARQQGFG